MRIVKDSPEDLAEQADFDLLEERLIPYPALAIAQCHRVMNGMAKKVRNNVNRSMNLINEFRPEKYEKVMRMMSLGHQFIGQRTFLKIHYSRLALQDIKWMRQMVYILHRPEDMMQEPDDL